MTVIIGIDSYSAMSYFSRAHLFFWVCLVLVGCTNSNHHTKQSLAALSARETTVCTGVQFSGDYQWIDLNQKHQRHDLNDTLQVFPQGEISTYLLQKIERRQTQSQGEVLSQFAKVEFVVSKEFGCVMNVLTSESQDVYVIDHQQSNGSLFLRLFHENEVSVILKAVQF